MGADHRYENSEEYAGVEPRTLEGLRHSQDARAQRRLQQVSQSVHVAVGKQKFRNEKKLVSG